MVSSKEITPIRRLVLGCLNGLVFSVCYLLANVMAHQRGNVGTVGNVALELDAHIPFVPWMVLPYLSSGLFLCAAFALVRSRDALRVLSQRLLLATAVAALVFVLLPLQFSGQRPAVDEPFFQPLFGFLALVDKPYNQLPSLHVAYGVVLWVSLREVFVSAWTRGLLGTWLMLMALAALFIYQHHLMDVLAGLLLGLACVRWVPAGRNTPFVALYYFVAGCVALVLGRFALPDVLTLYLVASLWLVCLAYAFGWRGFLHKRGGRFPWWVYCVYAPYLLGYRLSWLAVVWHERRHPVIRKWNAQLWTGRRLGRREAAQLPVDCTVFDLANELPETAALRGHRYRYFALFDLMPPPADVVDEIIAALQQEIDAGRCVYLHCAMGYGRCVYVAQAFLSAPSAVKT